MQDIQTEKVSNDNEHVKHEFGSYQDFYRFQLLFK